MHQDIVCNPIHCDVPAGSRLVLNSVLAQAKEGLGGCEDAGILQRPK